MEIFVCDIAGQDNAASPTDVGPAAPATLARAPTIGKKGAVLPLVLASASPRRADLLRAAGLDPTIAPVECDERWRAGEAPVAYARRIARAKAELAHAATPPGHVILAADTTVWIREDEAPLGKPVDADDAAATLQRLTLARVHRVTTAFTIVDTRGPSPRWEHGETTTEVEFRALSPAAIAAYVATDEWRGKAGGYAIQGHAAALVRGIVGSYTGVVGLPLAEVIERLEALDAPR